MRGSESSVGDSISFYKGIAYHLTCSPVEKKIGQLYVDNDITKIKVLYPQNAEVSNHQIK